MNTKRYFISIDGYCKDCKYPVICEAGQILKEVKGLDGEYDSGDFHLYCSNPDCKNHKGVCCYDTELDEVSFLNFKVVD